MFQSKGTALTPAQMIELERYYNKVDEYQNPREILQRKTGLTEGQITSYLLNRAGEERRKWMSGRIQSQAPPLFMGHAESRKMLPRPANNYDLNTVYNPSYGIDSVLQSRPIFSRVPLQANKAPASAASPRPLLTQAQTDQLEGYFNSYGTMDSAVLAKILAKRIGLTAEQINSWLIGRHMKEDKKMILNSLEMLTRLVNNSSLLDLNTHLKQCNPLFPPNLPQSPPPSAEPAKPVREELTNVFIRKLEQENRELKQELGQLKTEHQEMLSKLEKTEDVASRIATMERDFVRLAQGVVNLKVSTEKKFEKVESSMIEQRINNEQSSANAATRARRTALTQMFLEEQPR